MDHMGKEMYPLLFGASRFFQGSSISYGNVLLNQPVLVPSVRMQIAQEVQIHCTE